tara:strand:+ start:38 stop:325 length:288 start_codon:yes stop_codon:yes gene_type:complete
MIILDDLDVVDNSKDAIRTARSILRSKLMELAIQVDKNKHPTVEITEELKVLPNLNANWVKADMEQVFQTTILPTKKQEEHQEYLDKGTSVDEEE